MRVSFGRVARAALIASVIVAVAAGCTPPTTADSLDLGSLGTYSAPLSTVTGRVVTATSVHSGHTVIQVDLLAEARFGDGVLASFDMHSTFSDTPVVLPGVGDHVAALPAAGSTAPYFVVTTPSSTEVATGTLSISEITYGPGYTTDVLNHSLSYGLTRLRATMTLHLRSGADVTGSISIG